MKRILALLLTVIMMFGTLAIDLSAASAVKDVYVVGDDGKLAVGEAPAAGVYFVVTDKCTLTEKAIKARVCVA